MTFNKQPSFLALMLLSLCFQLPARADVLTDAITNYKLGSYQTMVESLEKFKPNQKQIATKFYLLGIAYNKLQNYEKAGLALRRAIQLKSDAPDIWYEFGQASYANSDLRMSLQSFKKSYSLKYKETESLYYMAHISQILEDYQSARDYYIKLGKHPQIDKDLVQVSRFQLGEVLLSMAESRDDANRLVESYVLPQMEQARKSNEKSDIAPEIETRIKEIQVRYGLDPNRLINGKLIPEQRWDISFQQEVNYDNNVTLATDVPTAAATQKESYIFDSTFNAKYLAAFKGKYLIEPSLRINNKKYAETSEPTVFQNDSYDITASTVFKREHTFKEKPATFGVGFDYKYIARDRLQQKQKILFARSTTISFFETLKLNTYGDTTLRFKIKDYQAFTEAQNNKTITLAADQIIVTSTGTLFIALVNADFISAETELNSTNAFLFRVDHLRPNFISNFTLSAGLGLTILDTKLQSETRGTEKTINPSFKLIKKINDYVSMQLTYDYTKNMSNDTLRYEYTKHVAGIRFRIKY